MTKQKIPETSDENKSKQKQKTAQHRKLKTGIHNK
jgi:hypothetical protein